MGLSPVSEADLAGVERWFAATLDHCRKLRGQQRHVEAENSAAGALKLFRTLHATEANHGFFADFLTHPYEGLFEEYVRT